MATATENNSDSQNYSNGTPSAAPAPPRARKGAPASNVNAARHFMTVGELPNRNGLAHIMRLVYRFRRQVEASVAERGSGQMVSLYEASLIDVACRHHRNALLAHKWLADELDKLTVADRMRFAERSAEHAEKRNATLAKLGLSGDRGGGGADSPWSVMDELADERGTGK